MFAELISILLTLCVLLIIDSFSVYFGLAICALITYLSLHNSYIVVNKQSIVHGANKLWAVISFCLQTKKHLCNLYERMFLTEVITVSQPSLSNSEFCGTSLSLENEIDTMVLNISQFYIQSWYGKISSNDDFVISLNYSIKQTLISLCTNVAKIDKKKFTYIVMQTYLHFFSHFVEAKNKSEVFRKENFKIKHWAMVDNEAEWCYLQSLVSVLLDSFCPSDCEKTVHSKHSPLIHNMVVEILTQNIIQPLVRELSNPSRLNSILLQILINSVSANEDVNNSSEIINQHPRSIVSSKMSSTVSEPPVILMPNEDLSDDSVFECKESKALPIEWTPELYRYTMSVEGIKSSSNLTLLEAIKQQPRFEGKCKTINRSKSADFICQIPQLKTLNNRSYIITMNFETGNMHVALKPISNPDVEHAERAFKVEVPYIFTNVKITGTIQDSEDGQPYTRYCIQYTGVFHDAGQYSDYLSFVQQVVTVKRRFKEFVALQSSLESNPSLKTFLKEIKGPSKWSMSPFSNLEKRNIAERKIFLENYLNRLCRVFSIALSVELHEFLAYGRDESYYTQKYAETPRLDKLVRGVKGALIMIKTALPNSQDDDSLPLLPKPIDDNSIVKFEEHLVDYSSREPEISEHITNFMNYSALNDASSDSKFNDSTKKMSLLRNVQYPEITECCDCPVLNERNFLQEKCPFGAMAFELVASSLDLNESNMSEIFTILKLLLVPYIDGIFMNTLDTISENFISTLIHCLHKYLWPDEKSDPQQSLHIDNPAILDMIMQHIDVFFSSTKLNVNSSLKQKVIEKTKLFLSSIQHQEINRCLLFQIFDVIIETTCV